MTDEQIALARRAVACRGWRLVRGMRFLLSDGGTTLITHETNSNGWVSATRGFYSRTSWAALDALPDLSDPATLGCLLAMVREAWGDECACVLPLDYGPGGVMWVCQLTAGGRSLTARHWVTEAEALVAALEAAP